jgi:uncharacterized RDD family membrane protein YckC
VALPEAAPTVDATAPASGSLARTLRSTQRAPGPAGQLLADAPHRAVALLVDMIVLGLIGIVVAATLGNALGGLVTDRTLESAGGELEIGPFAIVLVVVLALSLGYFVACWTRWQATIGMRLLGLAILDDGGGHHLSPGQAMIRWLLVGIAATIATVPVFVPVLLAVLLAIVALAALVGLLVTIGQSPTRQGLHDRYAGSIVTTGPRGRSP